MSLNTASFATETRMDRPQVVARDQDQCRWDDGVIGGGAAYPAGQVVGQVTSDRSFEDYDNGDADGTETAVGILTEAVDAASGDVVARVLYRGAVYVDQLTGLDANGRADLNARSIFQADGREILIF